MTIASQILEKLKAEQPAGDWIHDFFHSQNKKFSGDTGAKRIQRALGAWYAARRKAGLPVRKKKGRS